MSQKIEIYDSTLRDGAQAEGISYSLEDKLLIAKRLDVSESDVIEMQKRLGTSDSSLNKRRVLLFLAKLGLCTYWKFYVRRLMKI